MKITIIIPTHNEGESIGGLLHALTAVLKTLSHHTWNILIVDGNSTDSTLAVVKEKQSTHNNIHILQEKEKRGLGNAYITGMKYAINELAADAFMEFDGDFQHDPQDIPKLVTALDDGYDYIIGSRYIPGGSIPREWPWYRKLLSSLGNIIIKYGLRIKTKDNTSGFKLTRVSTCLPVLPLDHPLSLRHAYKIHFLYAVIASGAKTIEVPIQFLNRNKGVSKSAIEDIIESLKVIYWLNFRKDK